MKGTASIEAPARTLVLIRHGHAVQGADDELRCLSEQGRQEIADLAQKLASFAPKVVFCSSAVRTRQTAELLAKSYGQATLELSPDLYLASGKSLLQYLTQCLPDIATCWLVGHNPGLSDLARALTRSVVDLGTGEAVALKFSGAWQQLANSECSALRIN